MNSAHTPLQASKIWLIERCRARYLWEIARDESPDIPPNLWTTLGTAFHAIVLRRHWGSEGSAFAEFESELRAEFRISLAKFPTVLALTNAVLANGDLLRAFQRVALLAKYRTAVTIVDSLPGPILPNKAEVDVFGPLSRQHHLITGVFDSVSFLGEAIVITEFKSGKIFETQDGGDLIRKHWLQIMAYGYMMRTSKPTRRIILRVFGVDGGWERELTDNENSDFEAIAQEFSKVVLDASKSDVSAAASPGAICESCLFRPRCTRYVEWAEANWTEASMRMPLDIWGTIVGYTRDQRSATVTLRDSKSRLTRITGLPPENAVRLQPGEKFCGFELQTQETGRSHAHPQNFHILDFARPMNTAFNSRVFTR